MGFVRVMLCIAKQQRCGFLPDFGQVGFTLKCSAKLVLLTRRRLNKLLLILITDNFDILLLNHRIATLKVSG